MRKHWHILGLAAVLAAGAGMAGAAPARTPLTFVSASGASSGACTLAAPCKDLQFALDRTLQGGTVTVLTSGDYGPALVSAAVSIVAQGVMARISLTDDSCRAGICVRAGVNDVVQLRGLTFDIDDGLGHGVRFDGGAALHVVNCHIVRGGNDGSGISFTPGGLSNLFVIDTTIANVAVGIVVAPSDKGRAFVTLNRVRFTNVESGMRLANSGGLAISAALVRDSVFEGARRAAIEVATASKDDDTVALMVDNVEILRSGTGILASGPKSTVRIGNATISGNDQALVATGGAVIVNFPGNVIVGNSDDNEVALDRKRR